jgi:hypothetical protein
MFKLLLVLIISILFSCTSEPKRTRDSDKTLRIMVDPESIDSTQHAILQNELITTGKFYIVDRAKGFHAIKKEQEREQLSEESRFEDSQKYAHWGKLYGVGGVVVANLKCTENPSTENILWGVAHLATLGIFHYRQICTQLLELLDSNTGEIVTSVRNDFKTDSESYKVSWTDVVDKLVDAYPKYFEKNYKHTILKEYEAESKKSSKNQRKLSSGGE